MNINFELYKVFYEVANEKSISKGAEKLLISQPAVTQSIRTLEEQLGGKLFIRTPKGVVLTNEGEILYNYIKEGMNYFINGSNKFLSLKNLDSGVLNIGASTVISENILIDVLGLFHKKYPNVVINIYNDLTDNLVKKLRNGDLDLIVISTDNEYKDILFYDVCLLHDIFVSNEKLDITLDRNNINDFDIIIQKNPSVMRRNFDKSIDFEFSPKMEVVSHSLVCKLVSNGFGVGLVTKEFVNDFYEVKSNILIPSRRVVYGIKDDRECSFSCSEFIKMLRDYYEKM